MLRVALKKLARKLVRKKVKNLLLTTIKHALSVSLYEGIIFLSYFKEKRIKKCQKKRYYTFQELQEILGVSRPTIYNLLKKKEFRWIQLDDGKYRISKKSFDDWLDNLEQ